MSTLTDDAREVLPFYNNVQRLKLDVTTIAPIHGGRVYPWSDFAGFVNSKTN